MPIDKLSAEQALKNLRRNRLSIWPDGRKSKGRLGAYTSCDTTATFSFSQDDLIFTVGSCFAREIEKTLTALGFNLPATKIEVPEEERASGVVNEILNKYTTSAVVNELRWGLDLEPYPEDAFLDVGNGLVHDPHLNPNAPPVSTERAKQRRQRVHDLISILPSCRIFILTLGLVETWYDKKTTLLLNGTPPAPALNAERDRFTLQRQSYSDILADLEEIHALLAKYGHPEFKMLVSVSPVPFKSTFSGQDAIRANTYSKSALRAAAEEFCSAHDNVDYFPSFEMVTLSDRANAYMDDYIHVKPSMVSRIMTLAVSKYVQNYTPEEDDEDCSKFGDEPAQLWTVAAKLRAERKFDLAIKLLRKIEDSSAIPKTGQTLANFNLVLGMNLHSAGRSADAEPYLARAVALAPNNSKSCFTLGVVTARLRRPDALIHLKRAVELDPESVIYLCRLALQYEREKDPARAISTYRRALALEPEGEAPKSALLRLINSERMALKEQRA